MGGLGCGSDDPPIQAAPPPEEPAEAVTKTVVTIIEKAPKASDGGGDSGSAAPSFVYCDRNIQVRESVTSCRFAQGAFYEYWAAGRASVIRVYSDASGQVSTLDCPTDGTTVRCSSGGRAVVRFPMAAVDAYSSDAAEAFARSRRVIGSPYGGE